MIALETFKAYRRDRSPMRSNISNPFPSTLKIYGIPVRLLLGIGTR